MSIVGQKPKLVLMAVYKSKDNTWRGFCAPYDITCTTKTQKEAQKTIEKLVKSYEKTLEKYNYPPHLAVKNLSDSEDEKVRKMITRFLVDQSKKKMIQNFKQYQLEKIPKRKEFIKSPFGVYSSYQPAFA